MIDASIIDVHPDTQLQQTIDDRVKAMQRKQQAEAKANWTISNSLTDELLKKMEMEARMEHGWVTVQGTGTVVIN